MYKEPMKGCQNKMGSCSCKKTDQQHFVPAVGEKKGGMANTKLRAL